MKLQLHSAGDASPLPPQRAGKRALGAPGLTALLLPQMFPILHPTVRLVHGGVQYREHLREEQRSQPRGPQRAFPSALGWERGCIAGRMQLEFHRGLLILMVATAFIGASVAAQS